MPLIKSGSNSALKTNISTLMGDVGKSPHVQSRQQALAIAFENQRRNKADGGRLPYHATAKARTFKGGGIVGAGHGRADDIPLDVPDGAHVVPADVVSHLGDGNTAAGIKTLDLMFSSGVYGTKAPPIVRGNPRPMTPMLFQSRSRQAGMSRLMTPPRGGHAGMAGGGAVPIRASAGEFVVSPDAVLRWGNGNPDFGHEVIDEFIRQQRADAIKTLSNLPGPAQ